MVKGNNRYSVSCDGEVLCWNWCRTGKPRLCRLNTNNGYLTIRIDGVLKRVHRLVAEAFIPNPQNKPCIDHVDTNRQRNVIENLRWCTFEENSNNTLTKKHLSENSAHNKPWLGKFGAEHNSSIQIVQLTLDGKFIKKWSCGADVLRELGINKSSITQCCQGKRKSAGGYRWMYYSEWEKLQRKKPQDIKPLF